jgi:hypothetical protein
MKPAEAGKRGGAKKRDPLGGAAELRRVPAQSHSTPGEFVEIIRKDVEKWGKVIREANIRVQ